MKNKNRAPIERIKLKFKKGIDNLDELRNEISTCIICDNTLFLAYDESSAIERLVWKDGEYKKHKTFELEEFFDLPDGKEGEMDIEGLAWEAPFLWVTGSMSLKRSTPDEEDGHKAGGKKLAKVKVDKNRFSLGKIPCQFDKKKGIWTPVKKLKVKQGKKAVKQFKPLMLERGKSSTILTELLCTDPHLGPFMNIPCKENGFDIEGLAIYGKRIFVGLRGPVLAGWAVIIEFKLHEWDGWLQMEGRSSKEKPYNKHFVNMAGMGFREINIDAKSGDLYILAGPTMDLDGTIGAWRIKGGLKDKPVTVTQNPERLFDIVHGNDKEHGKDKAEGMAITNEGNYLIVYDNPSKDKLFKKRSVWADVFKRVK
ncbi:DUF3616 domain-containing protein [Limibacter armeniacum]|uniref:DUF3616 domain-containing protein n=1 Tax=Limibacter armeniacum TaxID=466084 RepID=UPI002FE5D113